MSEVPGYHLLGTVQVTRNSILQRAERETDHHRVILKLPRVAHPGPRERERYRRECRLLQRVSGAQGIPPTLGLDEGQAGPVLVLEDVGGRALAELLQEGPLEVGRCLQIGIALAETLAEVHRRGVVHKDIKPANILVGPQGEVWLIDFGAATLEHEEQADFPSGGDAEGTLAYMAPEQTGRTGQGLDYRSDFYSLGVTLYEALTGRKPFQGRDELEWFHAHLAQQPTPPHVVRASISPMVSRVVLKLLAKSPDERYQSAEGLEHDLGRCLEGLRRGRLRSFTLGQRDLPARMILPRRLYGREPEVRLLLDAFEEVARSGKASLQLVSGYAGVGKSSVVAAVQPLLRSRCSFFLKGKSDQLQPETPYATLTQAFGELVRQLLGTSDRELERWRQRLHDALEGNGQVLVDLVPQLELIIGKQPAVPELPPIEAQNRFNHLALRFLGVLGTTDKPLVLFLDDLQWADPGSMRLLYQLLTAPEPPALLVAGAYRDNEVDAVHPLTVILGDLRRAGARLQEIHLGPLSQAQTDRLVRDALPGASEEVTEPLGAALYEKTGGNPFFLLQLLEALHRDGLVTRATGGGWSWDPEQVRAQGYSDNVVDFLAGRLRRLAPSPQRLLQLAACVGNAFSQEVLAIISEQPAAEVERTLEQPLLEGLLVREGAERYRFLHDRIQQAAHALISDEERRAVHLRIGRLLYERLGAKGVKERLFDVVNQLNAGAPLLTDPGEREALARLDAEAGWQARRASAHDAAVTYFSMALQLFPGEMWTADRALAFQLQLDLASSEFMRGRGDEARLRLQALLARDLSRAERAAASTLLSSFLFAVGEVEPSVSCLLDCLESFGISIPRHPTWEEVLEAHEEVLMLRQGLSIDSIAQLPRVTDPDTIAALSALSALYSPAYFSSGHLFPFYICRLVATSLRHGNAEASVQGYLHYGFVLAAYFAKPKEGLAFGNMAFDLLERMGFASLRAHAFHVLSHITYWSRHLSGALDQARSGIHHGVLTGALQEACFCCTHAVTYRLALGHALTEVHQEAVARLGFVRKAGFRELEDHILPPLRFTQQMRGLTRAFCSLSGDDFDEGAFEARLTEERAPAMRCWYWLVKLQSRFMCGRYEEALEAADRARGLLWASAGMIQLLDYHLYRALAQAALQRAAPGESLAAIQEHHRQLRAWADDCPENFRAPERIVAAELARLSGRAEEALHAYEEAVGAARAEGFIQYVALANELAARFWKGRGIVTAALAYANEARSAYWQWGGEGKVRQLESEWPLTEAGAAGTDTTSSSFDSSSRRIDALTVVKAQQAISGEIELDRLVRTLLQVALENAGAERGALLLLEGERIGTVAFSEEGLQASEDLPWSLIAFVRRTQEMVLISDATESHSFSHDRYFEQHHARSVMALPLLARGTMHGVLYLENSLTTDAFTPGSQTLLGHIATQAAISVENARLYEQARQEVRRRDDFLEIAAHELKTPLTPLRLQIQGLESLARASAPPPQETLLRRLQSVDKQVERLGGLVKSLLEISVISQGQLELELAEVDLVALVRTVLERFSPAFARAGCAVEVRLPGMLVGTWDAPRIEQVLGNLLANAVKYGPGHPIEVTVEGSETEARLTVTDHGAGIAPEDQARIFDRFERAVSVAHYGGFGLGLWVARELVRAHGGAIAVQSVPGHGATFTVTLPRRGPLH